MKVLHSLQTYIEAAVVRFVLASAYTTVRNGNTIHTDMDHILILWHGSAMDRLYIILDKYMHEVTSCV